MGWAGRRVDASPIVAKARDCLCCCSLVVRATFPSSHGVAARCHSVHAGDRPRERKLISRSPRSAAWASSPRYWRGFKASCASLVLAAPNTPAARSATRALRAPARQTGRSLEWTRLDIPVLVVGRPALSRRRHSCLDSRADSRSGLLFRKELEITLLGLQNSGKARRHRHRPRDRLIGRRHRSSMSSPPGNSARSAVIVRNRRC